MSTTMRIDVVITSYNYGRFLGATIDSALSQEGVTVHVIVVDDGSVDDSRDVIAGYGDRITAILQENRGQAAAFNAGVAVATGDAVAFLDSDDLLLPGALQRAAAALKKHPDAVKVQWAMELADADGVPTGARIPPDHVPMPNGDVRAAELAYGFDLFWAATSGNLLPSAVVRRLFPIPAEAFPAMDAYLHHLPPLLGPVVSLREVGTLRRVHGANSYEQAADGQIDLSHVRRSIRMTDTVIPQIVRLAGELGLERRRGPMLSVSSVANRMISFRLDPAGHPVPQDGRLSLLNAGIRAASRRHDVHPLMRVMFACWFLTMATLPRPLARRLAQWFLFPEQRRGINRLLAPLHRSGDRGGS